MSHSESRSRAFQVQRTGGGLSGHLTLAVAAVAVAFGLAVGAGCGKKGAPVPPATTVAAPAPKATAPPATEPSAPKERRRMQPLPPP